MLLRKSESYLEKKKFHWRIFFQSSQNVVRKKKVYMTKIVIQNSATKCYHEFHLRSHKDLKMLILEAPFLSLTKVIL